MPVSYVGAIRSVLDTYPPSKGLFREILQNSEDAKATKQIFVLDRRTSSDVVVEQENPIISQRPALLAYNDSTFTERDFKSLFNLWDSSKKADTSDTPQVLSQSTLAILDPLNKNDDQTDMRIELDNDEQRAEIINPLSLHLFQPNLTPCTVFRGTVVRLPFREIPSEISPKVFSATDIHRLLEDFVKDEIRIALLFLTNVASIEIFEIELDGQVTCLAKTSISRSQETILEDVLGLSCTPSFVDLVETTEVNDVPQPTQHWRILRTSFSHNLASSELSKRLGFDAASKLAEHKLHPVLAIAVKLSILVKPDTTIGRLFTYLPLPLFTRFCVHVHGLFALTPSREKLQNREEKPAHGTVYHISIEWNKLLFEEYLPQVWMCLLCMLTESGITNVFDAWPPPQKANQLGDSGYWERLPENLVENVIKSKCSVWPVFGSPGRFCELENVLVAGEGEQDKLLVALAACGLNITRPPGFIVDLLKRCVQANVKFLTPAAAHSSLLALRDKLASSALENKLPVILEYLLSAKMLEYIIDLPIISTPNGHHIALTRRSSSSTVHVLLEKNEYDLFKACDENAITLGYIDIYLADLLRQDGPSILNVELLTPAVVTGYLQNHAMLKVPPGTGMEPTTITWISNFWLWMRDWRSSHQLYPSLGQLSLLPTQDGLKPTHSPVFESTGIHPLLLPPLKTLRVPFLHQAFSPNSAARSALYVFRNSSDVRSLSDLLDALDLDTVKSFVATTETARRLASYVSNCTVRHLNDNQCRKLRALPIFPSHPLSSIQGRIRIPDGHAVFGVVLKYLRFLPSIAETIILDGSQSEMIIALLRAIDPGTRGLLSDLDVLRLGLTQFAAQPNITQQAIVDFMALNRSKVPGELIEILGRASFVAVGDGSRRPPREIVDPQSPLRVLYETGSCFLPHNNYKGSMLIANLRALNLMQAVLSTDILRERIHHITTTQDHVCARELVRVIYDTRFTLPRIDDIYKKWLPTPKGLLDPHACRDDRHQKALFDRVLSPLDYDLKTDHSFRASFDWDQPIPVAILSQQLRLTLIAAQDNMYTVVYDIVKELMERKLSDQEILQLRNVVAEYSWVPVSGTSRLARPSTTAILNRLSSLKVEVPSPRVANKALRLLSLLPDNGISDNDRSRVFVPDIDCTLRPLHSVFYNDIGERAVLVGLSNDQHLAHNMISEPLAVSLGMDRLGLKFIDLKPLGIDMGEELTTTIGNKLRSYTPRQILAEFIANASDAGATEFGVVTDETTLSSNRILSQPLAQVLDNHSLVLYNDAVFTAADFDGICQTGVGGKSNRRDSIGQFGFGALTMFHLTDVSDILNFAMIVSGSSVLLLEPSKQLLPIRGRATLLLPLQHVKRTTGCILIISNLLTEYLALKYPLQMITRTLFRLPLRRHVGNFSLGEAWDIHRLRKDLIEPFEDHGEEFLLFTSIRTITINRRTSLGIVCSRMISSVLKEERIVDEFKTKIFDVTIHINGAHHNTETQSWHIVSNLTSVQQEISRSLLKYRLRSPVTLTIAARVDTKINPKREKELVYKFFSSLPLISSYLPVHISAPFILSDDRRQIRLDNLDPAAADYNQWLLSTAIPPLYLFLLSHLLQHNRNNIAWWPGDAREENELTKLVTSSFYERFLKASHQRVFLPTYKVESTPLTSGEAVLVSPQNHALAQVFRLLDSPLVLLPSQLVRRAHAAGLTQLTPAYLSSLVRRSPVNPAEHLRFKKLDELLRFLGQSADDLLGLRLLPLSSGEFGVIERAEGASRTYFIAPKSVHALFPANERLIHPEFKPPQSVLHLLLTMNVQQFAGSSLKLLIGTKLQEGSITSHDRNLQAWIESFWNSCIDMNVDLKSISTFPLVPTTRSGFYTSIDNCRNHSAVILSTRYADAWLWPMLSDLGLTVVQRHSDNFPRCLEDALSSRTESSIFTDVLSAMAPMQQTILGRFVSLDTSVQSLFADWCRRELESISSIPNHLLTFTRRLPIWPVTQLDGLLVYRSADSVTMLPPRIRAELAGRFMNIPSTPHSIGFLRLKKNAMSFAVFFGSLDLPQVLSREDVLPYKNLLAMFLNHSRNIPSSATLRIPDANLVLRHPRDLYAHDPLFLSTFEGSPASFILNEFLDMEHLFFAFGMKREANLDIHMFTACARALHTASLVSNVDPERARIVFEAYCEALPLRISSPQRYLWSTLNDIRFIPRDPSRRKSSVPAGLNPDAYARSLPAVVSPSELMLPEFEPIVWTQRAHFLHQPGERIHIANPSLGHPSFSDVVEHLRTLALRILRDFPSSPRLLAELTKTYEWLNNNCENTSNAGLLVTLHAEALFLNVADASDFATWEWHTADQLLLNETKVVSRFHPVKAFLLPFEKLLRTTGVKSVKHPEAPSSSQGPSDSEQLASIRKAFQEMRQARLLTDVEFVAADDDDGEEEILPCHRTFLATYSSFFYDAFTNEMEPANLDASVVNPKIMNVEEYSSRCVSCALGEED
ncbi:hypothetical protein C0995_005217 [Termitomyces sp. Mi166|nr:hypothetical protein C0995_005217 [Termitomyces sp. Mi166\